MNNLISVIIPVFNSEKYLGECIDSILRQDYEELEVIIVNDGSTDNSDKICRSYKEKYENIVYIEQKNKGVSAARNRGIQEATGKYITFIDSDDRIEKNYFETLCRDLIREKADLSLVSIVDSLGNAMCAESTIVDFKKNIVNDFLILNKKYLLYGPVAKLYKSELIVKQEIKFPEELSYGEDLVFNCRYLKECNRIVYNSKISYFYRRDNQESLSQKFREDRFSNELILCDELKKMFCSKKIYNKEYEQYLEERLFDEGYNGIFDILKSDLSMPQKIKKMKNIMQQKQFKASIKWIPENKYSGIILRLMKKGYPVLLMGYYQLRK